MKRIPFALLLCICLSSCAGSQDRNFTGSTPAGVAVRNFLGISLTDSIDFIRWKLKTTASGYELHCQYGIGKPNTNGFMNGGSHLKLSGGLESRGQYYHLRNGEQLLSLLLLNNHLLHLVDKISSLLVGNGGWSYTLNSITASPAPLNVSCIVKPWTDSVVLEGRTPCGVPGANASGSQCYKLKWKIMLFPGNGTNNGKYHLKGITGPAAGSWQSGPGKNGAIQYQLTDEKSKGVLYLLKIDKNVLVFTDAAGNLLVGNEDFSYTMNISQEH